MLTSTKKSNKFKKGFLVVLQLWIGGAVLLMVLDLIFNKQLIIAGNLIISGVLTVFELILYYGSGWLSKRKW